VKVLTGILTLTSTIILTAGASLGQVAGCPDLELSTIVQNVQQGTTLLVMPDGSGPPLSEAVAHDGSLVDAGIHLTLFSSCPPTGPMAHYPAEDMWLEPMAGNLVFCTGGSIADEPTDDQGITFWSRPLKGGGWDMGSCLIRLGTGDSPVGFGLPLYFNSPDLNADLVVNLTDVAEFAGDFFSTTYEFRSDLHFDQVVNLSDLAAMTGTVGTACP
jgi:hypothetical protein